MTFDDGILTVYRTENTAKPGKKPVPKLKVKGKHYFNYGELGYNRIYRAKQAGQQVEAVGRYSDDRCMCDGKRRSVPDPYKTTYSG